MELLALLAVVTTWGVRCKLDEFQLVTAQSLAWYWWDRSKVKYPASHWARLAVRWVRAGRDLAWCGTGPSDALNHQVQGAGMGEVMDRTPPPDALASHIEEWERLQAKLTLKERQVQSLRIQGIDNGRIALAIGVSPARTSQLARSILEKWEG